ncbi:SWIM-type domain-containing protein [Aphis craccivora]|uniref:SWIM-type domain-containing protein n=1 Tax=Aphis craccivora TaxID=307492 RepID=A0A6G0VTS6_APHCR|nr:SWIM-type domain-containing protein [Aphis craccivora]
MYYCRETNSDRRMWLGKSDDVVGTTKIYLLSIKKPNATCCILIFNIVRVSNYSNVKFNEKKALNLVKSNHVINVQEIKSSDDQLNFISGHVIRQTSVTSMPYKLDETRTIRNAFCECVVGAGERCKHIGALFYFINNEESYSQTDFPQTWGKPSKAGEKKYKKGKRISELFPVKKQKLDTMEVNDNNLFENHELLDLYCPLSINLKIEMRTEVDLICEKTLKYIIDEVDKKIIFETNNPYLNTLILRQKLFPIVKSPCNFPLNFELSEFYFNLIFVTEEKIKTIFNQTINQSDQYWLNNRKFRISASTKVHKIKTLKILTHERQISLAKSLLDSKPLIGKAAKNVKYGYQTENKAFEAYSKMVGFEVIKCGLVVHVDKHWLCASPDGIVLINNRPNKVLDIKCPITCQDKSIIDPVTNIPNVKYLKLINGEITLKKSHSYYSQCQILMYVTGLDECDLFVYKLLSPVLIFIKNNNKQFSLVIKERLLLGINLSKILNILNVVPVKSFKEFSFLTD